MRPVQTRNGNSVHTRNPRTRSVARAFPQTPGVPCGSPGARVKVLVLQVLAHTMRLNSDPCMSRPAPQRPMTSHSQPCGRPAVPCINKSIVHGGHYRLFTGLQHARNCCLMRTTLESAACAARVGKRSRFAPLQAASRVVWNAVGLRQHGTAVLVGCGSGGWFV